jgi:hypothetical protein
MIFKFINNESIGRLVNKPLDDLHGDICIVDIYKEQNNGFAYYDTVVYEREDFYKLDSVVGDIEMNNIGFVTINKINNANNVTLTGENVLLLLENPLFLNLLNELKINITMGQ